MHLEDSGAHSQHLKIDHRGLARHVTEPIPVQMGSSVGNSPWHVVGEEGRQEGVAGAAAAGAASDVCARAARALHRRLLVVALLASLLALPALSRLPGA
jgi:hypothetical protein